MTENRDREINLPSPPSMLLMRAARIASFDAAEGWPDALTFDELAALQFPEEGAASGTGMGPSHDRPNQTDFHGLLAAFVKRGEVAAVKADRPMPIFDTPQPMWPCDALERPAASRALEVAELSPSELVGVWLGPDWHVGQMEAPKPESCQDGKKTDKREKQIQAIVDTARALEYDLLDIPLGGRAAIMTHCLKHRKEFGASENSFDNAWGEANKQGRIRIHGKERFMTE